MRRIVPNIYSNDIEKSKDFYTRFLGMKLAMDMGWIQTYVSKDNPTAQISIFENKGNKVLDNSALFLSIEVSEIDKWHKKAQNEEIAIVYPIRNEDWGVRRFFIK